VIFEILHTGTTVIRALGAGKTTLGPTVRRTICIEECVLLLKTKPRDVFFRSVHDLDGVMAVVGSVRGAVIVIGFGKDEDVVAATEGVFENCGGAKVDVGVVARGLVCR
jgi:hypothetical protein